MYTDLREFSFLTRGWSDQITYSLRRYSPHRFAATTDLILKVKKEKRWDQDLGLVFNMKEEIY